MTNLEQIEALSNRLYDRDRDLQEFINIAPVMLWKKDLENRFIYVNKEICEKLLLLPRAEVMGKTGKDILEILQGKGIDYTAGIVCTMSDDDCKQRNIKSIYLEDFIVNGKKMILKVYKKPIFDSDNKMIGTIGAGTDITKDYKEHLELKKIYLELVKDVERYKLNVIPIRKKLDKFKKVFLNHINADYFSIKDNEKLISL